MSSPMASVIGKKIEKILMILLLRLCVNQSEEIILVYVYGMKQLLLDVYGI
jgi:hypothetical protein